MSQRSQSSIIPLILTEAQEKWIIQKTHTFLMTRACLLECYMMWKNSGVVTIGGTDCKPTGIGTVKWYWKDDKLKSHTHRLERALYFPESPVNIISSTAWDDQYDDNDGTYIKAKRRSSKFCWNFGQYTRTITHSDNCLAGIPINDGYEVFGVLLKRMKYQTDPRIYFFNCSYMTQTDLPEDSKLPRVDFRATIVPDDEYSSNEEEDNESIYMEHLAELENAKPHPNRVDAPPTALLDA